MGEYVHLNLSTSSSPSERNADYLNGETEVLYKWSAAIAWLALFRSEDFLEQPYYPFGSDSESFPGLYLVTDLSKAIRNLDDREPKLAHVFGSPWTENIAEFKRYLNDPKATHVELNASELLDDDNPSDVVRDNLDEYIRIFDEPLHSGKKKTVFSGAEAVAWMV